MAIPAIPIDPFLLQTESVEPKSFPGDEVKQQEKLKKVAHDFETVFLHQVMNVMKDSVPDEETEDSSGEQIQGMYWSFMAQAIGEQGGTGLWKDIFSAMADGQKSGYREIDGQSETKGTLDETI
jgi:Rod binding domain-containing protein